LLLLRVLLLRQRLLSSRLIEGLVLKPLLLIEELSLSNLVLHLVRARREIPFSGGCILTVDTLDLSWSITAEESLLVARHGHRRVYKHLRHHARVREALRIHVMCQVCVNGIALRRSRLVISWLLRVLTRLSRRLAFLARGVMDSRLLRGCLLGLISGLSRQGFLEIVML